MEIYFIVALTSLFMLVIGFVIGWVIGSTVAHGQYKHYHVSAEKPDYTPDKEFRQVFNDELELTIIKDGLAGYEENSTSKRKWFNFYIREEDEQD